VELDNTEDS